MGLLVAIVLAVLPAPVTLQGISGVKLGMTVAQVSKQWGARVALGPPSPGSTCRTARISKGAVKGYAIFERGRFGAVFFEAG
jgi:hypothetical protein